MKKALISYQGWVQQIVDPGQDYEIYEGPDATIAWVDAPDEIQLDWTLEWSPSQQKMVWVERDAPYTNNAVARKVAYGEIGQQLDLIYHDIAEHGAITTDGSWFQHISAVKAMIDKPEPPPAPTYIEDLIAGAVAEEPHPDKPNIPSSPELQAWRRYPGWKGNQSE